jgi:hypothetical protein
MIARTDAPRDSERALRTDEKIVVATVIEILALAVGVGFAINFFFYAWPRGDKSQIIIASATAIIFATIGVAAHLLARLPTEDPTASDVASVALKRLTEQNDAALRPYVGVSYLKATIEVGKPVSVRMQFTNSGKTPAEEVEILGRLERFPPRTPINRKYDGPEFQGHSVGPVNAGNTVENQIVGGEMTLPILMELTTTGESVLFVHGIIRYHSKYIPGGKDETPFCYEFDRTSGQMVLCRVNTTSA